jgi:hypothetical protein
MLVVIFVVHENKSEKVYFFFNLHRRRNETLIGFKQMLASTHKNNVTKWSIIACLLDLLWSLNCCFISTVRNNEHPVWDGMVDGSRLLGHEVNIKTSLQIDFCYILISSEKLFFCQHSSASSISLRNHF